MSKARFFYDLAYNSKEPNRHISSQDWQLKQIFGLLFFFAKNIPQKYAQAFNRKTLFFSFEEPQDQIPMDQCLDEYIDKYYHEFIKAVFPYQHNNFVVTMD